MRLAQKGAAMSASARSQLALAVDLRDASVLLVDDTPEQSEELLITLTEAGFKVMTASSGPQAKQKLMQGGADLVLLDLKGEDMDSYELCRQLKAPPPLRSVPVVFLSAPSGDDVDGRVRAFRAGAADYLPREADFAELLVRLEHHIRLGRKVRELERERVELLRENRDLKKEKQTAPPPILTNLADLPTGYVLDGKYRLDTRIGAGGFGVVYRAMHLSLQRAVAVKLFRSMANGSTDDALRRFRHEGTSASRLSHPNAVTMLDSGVAPGGIPYLAMELLVGRTLAEELKDKQRLGFARCLQIILPVCDVLVEAHAAGIVHRDIKPENVFLHRTRSGEVIKVLDFGIAKLVGEGEGIPAVTGAGGFIGTPTYMAPERLRQGSYDGRSDVYSVGVMLYQMLSGRPPFESPSQSYLEIVLGHLNQPPQPLRERRPSIPESVSQVVMHTLEKDPQSRPTARQLLTDLVRVVRKSVGQLEAASEAPARSSAPVAASPARSPSSSSTGATVGVLPRHLPGIWPGSSASMATPFRAESSISESSQSYAPSTVRVGKATGETALISAAADVQRREREVTEIENTLATLAESSVPEGASLTGVTVMERSRMKVLPVLSVPRTRTFSSPLKFGSCVASTVKVSLSTAVK